MIVPDVNLLLYAYDDTSSAHQAASRWWGDRLNGQEFVGISTLTILAFVRLSTKPGLFVNPYSTEEAGTVVRGWFQSPARSAGTGTPGSGADRPASRRDGNGWRPDDRCGDRRAGDSLRRNGA